MLYSQTEKTDQMIIPSPQPTAPQGMFGEEPLAEQTGDGQGLLSAGLMESHSADFHPGAAELMRGRGGNFAPRGHLAESGDLFDCCNGEGATGIPSVCVVGKARGGQAQDRHPQRRITWP